MSVSTTNPKEKQLLPAHSIDGDVCVGVNRARNFPNLKAQTNV